MIIRGSAFSLAALLCLQAYSLPPKTEVDSSTIGNQASGDNNAAAGSTVNRGIEARGSKIVDSDVSNTTSGNVNAVSSSVDTGVKLNGAEIKGSTISANSKVSIDAVNSSVKAGSITLSGANGANVSTDVNAVIGAKNSTVTVGTVSGSADGVDAHASVGAAVSAENKTVSIGNITLNGGGGAPAGGSYKDRHEKAQGQKGGGTSIGNVVVDSSNVDEVNTTVGNSSGGVGEKIKTRNFANTYKDGVDPSGTKNVYVDKKEAEAAERAGRRGGQGSAGNVYVGNDEKDKDVKKVNVYVDK